MARLQTVWVAARPLERQVVPLLVARREFLEGGWVRDLQAVAAEAVVPDEVPKPHRVFTVSGTEAAHTHENAFAMPVQEAPSSQCLQAPCTAVLLRININQLPLQYSPANPTAPTCACRVSEKFRHLSEDKGQSALCGKRMYVHIVAKSLLLRTGSQGDPWRRCRASQGSTPSPNTCPENS